MGLGIPFLPHPAHSSLALPGKLQEELDRGMELAEISYFLCFGAFFFFFPSGKISGLVHYRTAPTALNSTVGGRGSNLAALPQNCSLGAGTVFFWLCIKAKPNSLVKGNCHPP